MSTNEIVKRAGRGRRRVLRMWIAGVSVVVLALAGLSRSHAAGRPAWIDEPQTVGQEFLAKRYFAAEERVATARKLAEADKDNAARQHDLSVSLIELGDITKMTGNGASALAAYEESLAIARKLAAVDSGNAELRYGVSLSLASLASCKLWRIDIAGARAAYEESLAILRGLADTDKDNTRWQHEVSVSLHELGNVKAAADDKTGALAAYEESLAFARKLAAAESGNKEWLHDLSVGLVRLGNFKLQLGDRAGAVAAYEEDLALAQRRFALEGPESVAVQEQVIISNLFLADATKDTARRRIALEQALAMIKAQKHTLWRPEAIEAELAK